MTNRRTHLALAEEARESYIFNPERSYLSLIIPRASVNLVFDPETSGFAAGVTDYTAVGAATLVSNTVRQRRGVHGIAVTDVVADSGIQYAVGPAAGGGQPYAFSFDHFGQGRYRAYIRNGGAGPIVATTEFEGQHFWTRQEVLLYSPSSVDPILCVVAVADGNDFYVDGFQFEQGAEATTFISGNLREEYAGRAQYGWLGAPHNSASYRLLTARTGGVPVPMDELGFQLYELLDFGLPKPEHIFSNFALRPGGYYHRSTLKEREISFVGSLGGDGFRDLLCARNTLAANMSTVSSRPFRMHFQAFDCKTPLTEAVEFDAVYTDGLNGDIKSLYEERPAITLTMPDPFFYAYGEAAAPVDLYTTATDTGPGITGRDGDGTWSALGDLADFPIADFTVTGMVVGEDYNLYVVGYEGVGNSSYVLRWDGLTWSQVGPEWEDDLRAITWGPGNTLLFAGRTAREVGDPAAVGYPVWQYDLATDTYSIVGNGRFNNSAAVSDPAIRALAMHPDGYLIIGGAFTEFSEDDWVTPIDVLNIIAYDFKSDSWTTMGTGLVEPFAGGPVGVVNAIAIGPDKSVWAGGTYDPGVVDEPTLLARFHFSTLEWYRIYDYPMVIPAGDARILGRINALAFSRNGDLYIGGQFNTSRGRDESYDDGDPLPLTNLARYTPTTVLTHDDRTNSLFPINYGTNFEEIIGMATLRTEIRAMAVDCGNILYFGGTFTAIRVPMNQSGTGIFVPVDIPVPGIAAVNATNGSWFPPLTNLKAPTSFGSALDGVSAIAAGGNCNQNNGGGILANVPGGNPSLTEMGLAVPPGADDTIFAAAFVVIGAAIPTVDTIDVDCAVEVRPLIRFTGPGILYGIENFTNGTAIVFDKVVLLESETLTVDLNRPRPVAYRANGDTSGLIASGSSLIAFRLDSGENRIKATFRDLSDTDTPGDRTVTMQWRPKYPSIDAVCGGCA